MTKSIDFGDVKLQLSHRLCEGQSVCEGQAVQRADRFEIFRLKTGFL